MGGIRLTRELPLSVGLLINIYKEIAIFGSHCKHIYKTFDLKFVHRY